MRTTTPHRGTWDWNGHPVQLGYAFRLHRRRGDRVLEAVCALRRDRADVSRTLVDVLYYRFDDGAVGL